MLFRTALGFLIFRLTSGLACFDTDPYCSSMGVLCNDTDLGNQLREFCPATCGVCPGCYDSIKECPEMKDVCTTDGFKQAMQANCSYTCGRCPNSGCDDTLTNCAQLAYACNSTGLGAAMRESCPKTCGRCCADTRHDCAQMASVCKNSLFKEAMERECPKTCGICNGTWSQVGYTGWIYNIFLKAWYKSVCEPLSYDDMEKRCSNDGGHLASIHSESENAFVANIRQCDGDKVWIGLRVAGLRLKWEDNSTYDFTSMGAGCTERGDCRLLNANAANHTWCTNSCSVTYPGICKKLPPS